MFVRSLLRGDPTGEFGSDHHLCMSVLGAGCATQPRVAMIRRILPCFSARQGQETLLRCWRPPSHAAVPCFPLPLPPRLPTVVIREPLSPTHAVARTAQRPVQLMVPRVSIRHETLAALSPNNHSRSLAGLMLPRISDPISDSPPRPRCRTCPLTTMRSVSSSHLTLPKTVHEQVGVWSTCSSGFLGWEGGLLVGE